MCFFLFHSGRIVSPDVEFTVDGHFLSELRKIFWPFLLASMVAEYRILGLSNLNSLLGSVSFLFVCFPDLFFWSFVFKFLIRIHPGMDFFWVYFVWSWFSVLDVYLLPHFGSFHHYFFKYSLIFTSFHLSGTPVMQVLDLLLLPHRYLRPCSWFFFSVCVFSLLFRVAEFYCSVLKFTNSMLVIFIILLSPPAIFFLSLYIFYFCSFYLCVF